MNGAEAANAGTMPAGGKTGKSIFICAGDVSGGKHAAKVVRKLKGAHPDLQVWGMGSPALEAAGMELFRQTNSLALFGIMAVVKHLPELAKLRSNLVTAIKERKPDAVILVDYGGFNLSLAQLLQKHCPEQTIVYFISPQVWGSRPWRINVIAAACKKVLVIFPFEEALYRSKGIDATFVGHPLAESSEERVEPLSKEAFCAKHNLDQSRPIIAIFPGSRPQEIRDFMGFLLKAVGWLAAERPELQFVMSQANPRIGELIYDGIERHKARHLMGAERQQTPALKIIASEDNDSLMSASDLIWAKSGTTTLEAVLMEKPMLVFYRADWLSFLIFLCFKRVQYIAWPNLLAGRMLVPELIQLDCRAEKLVKYTRDWLDVPAARLEIVKTMKAMKQQLGKGDFASNAAAEIEKIIGVTTDKAIGTHG
jgi:lipid-A-disaccharide synthase